MLRPLLLVIALSTVLSACNNSSAKSEKKEADTAPTKLVIAPEDILTLQGSSMTSGPVITGSIQPERKADLRAEVSAVVMQVLKENGDVVRRGDILVRLDETAIRDNLNSAQDAARNSTLALDQAERNLQRLKTLRASGMTSLQALDEAEVRRNGAQSDLSASNARAATARQQLQRTQARAPFDGVVSERKVSAGDTASVGKELLKVIDPSSMRFEGRISADKVSQVKLGQAVSFRINGYPQDFRGKVMRINPSANDITRQVEILVGFSDAAQPRVSGLYAEGNIETTKVSALTLPEGALVKAGDKTSAWRVKDQKLSKVLLTVGPRDARTGYYEVRSGLVEGDVVMRTPNSNFKDGQDIEAAVSKPMQAASAPLRPPASATTTAATEGK